MRQWVLLAKQRLLRLGIILYGFRITVQQIADVGVSGVIDVLVLSSTFLITRLIGIRVLKMDRETVWLIGAGSSICAAAVLASEPVIKAAPSKVAVVVATVVLFGTVGIVLYPFLLDAAAAGQRAALWRIYRLDAARSGAGGGGWPCNGRGNGEHGGDRQDAAGDDAGTVSADPGSWLQRQRSHQRQAQQPIRFPWFALLFIVVALFASAATAGGRD